MNNRQMLWLTLGALMLGIAMAAIYKAWPLLFPKAAVIAKVDSGCNLRQGACTTHLENGGSIRFSITPKSIPVIEPLTLKVKTTGFDVESAEVDFSGTDMYMGFNRAKLKASGKGEFSGEGRIPVCVTDAMEWEAKVMLHTANGLYVAPYRFITVKSAPKPTNQE